MLNHLLWLQPGIRTPIFWIAWVLNLLFIVFTALCAFVPFRFYLFNKNRMSFLPALFITFVFPIYFSSYDPIWRFLGNFSSQSVSGIFSAVWGHKVLLSMTEEGFVRIAHPVFSVVIGKGCMGMESLLLFSCVFLTFFSLNHRNFSKGFWVWIFAMGLLLMYVMNIIRVVLLFWSGVWLRNGFGFERGTFVFRTIAHAQLGWVLYLSAIIWFFGWLNEMESSVTNKGFSGVLQAVISENKNAVKS